MELARSVAAAGDGLQSMRVIGERQRLLDDERQFWDADTVHSRAEVEVRREVVGRAIAATQEQGMSKLPMLLAGARAEDAAATVWSGTATQIAKTIRGARAAGIEVHLVNHVDHVWELSIGGEQHVFQEREATPRTEQVITIELAGGEGARVQDIRAGEPGRVRDGVELSSRDVADAMNAQLQHLAPQEIRAIVEKFPGAEASVRHALARATGFARMDSFNALRAGIEPYLASGAKLYTPGSGSLADNLVYLASKKTFAAQPGAIATATEIEDGCVVILDDVVLARVRRDANFARDLRASRSQLVQPRGLVDGIDMFAGGPAAIEQRLKLLLDDAVALTRDGTSFDDALDQALDRTAVATLVAADPALIGQLRVVDPAHDSTPATETDAALADRFNDPAGLTPEQLDDVLRKAVPGVRALLREIIAQQAEVFSPRRIVAELAGEHARILTLAAIKGIAPDHIYYFVPEAGRSFGMMAMAYREATGLAPDQFVNGKVDLRARRLGPDTMLVVLDDVAGSGTTLREAWLDTTDAAYQGQVVIAPMVSTPHAARMFDGQVGIQAKNPNVTYMPNQAIETLLGSDWYRGLTAEQQGWVDMWLGSTGYQGNGTSIAFPYMAPDNNNQMFGDQLAPSFVVNHNRAAVKTRGTWPPRL